MDRESFERSERANAQYEARKLIEMLPKNVDVAKYSLAELGKDLGISSFGQNFSFPLSDPKAVFEIAEYLLKEKFTAQTFFDKYLK